MSGNQIAIDLDGVLANYDGWKGNDHIGEINENVKQFILKLIENGFTPVIFTARAMEEYSVSVIRKWLKQNNMPGLEITNIKKKEFIAIIDDRAIGFLKNSHFCENCFELWCKNNAKEYQKFTDIVKDKLKNKKIYNPLNVQVGGDHYKKMPIQPIEYCHANNIPFIESSVIKYVTRHKLKGEEKDIQKAIHLLQLLLKLEYDKNEG